MSSEDCTRGKNGRETAKRKTKKEDAGSTYGARGQEEQLRGAEERSTKPGRMAPSSLEPAIRQCTHRRRITQVTKDKKEKNEKKSPNYRLKGHLKTGG